MQTSRSRLSDLILFVAGALVIAIPVYAHHSFTMFDATKEITLTGTVTKFEWTNPHSYIEIDAPNEAGIMKHWTIEMGSPSILIRSGWKFNSLKNGDKTTLKINPLKNGDAGGLLNSATIPDGRTIGNGPGRGPTAK